MEPLNFSRMIRERLRKIILFVTSCCYVKGLPRFLWMTRRFFLRSEQIYHVSSKVRVHLDPGDYFQWMMAWNYYCPEIKFFLKKFLTGGDVFIDVGAHIGYFTLWGARRWDPWGKLLLASLIPGLCRYEGRM